MKYDIVFWAHGDNETSRYIPLMVKLQEKRVKTLLFYMNYRAIDGISSFNKRIINRFQLESRDYSHVFRNSIIFKSLSFLVDVCRVTYLRNKFIGLRSKILAKLINRKNIGSLLADMEHKINIFDFIAINKNTKYPYGGFYVKDISSSMGKKNIAVPHGISVYNAEHLYIDGEKLGFDRIFVADSRYKDYMVNHCVEEGVEVTVLGDPRFDSKWKQTLKDQCRKGDLIDNVNSKNYSKIILYLCPNLEQIRFDSHKYANLQDVAEVVKNIAGAVLLIKPHPRYRNEKLIRKAMKEINLKDFMILSDDPAICYADIVDYVISSATSAFFDFLPEHKNKVLVYDDFMKERGIKNLFEGYIRSLNDPEELSRILSLEQGDCYNDPAEDQEFDINELCSEMVGGGNSTNQVIDNYCDCLIKELEG